jgi:hypothetical protein
MKSGGEGEEGARRGGTCESLEGEPEQCVHALVCFVSLQATESELDEGEFRCFRKFPPDSTAAFAEGLLEDGDGVC